jgi:hypothetical protein
MVGALNSPSLFYKGRVSPGMAGDGRVFMLIQTAVYTMRTFFMQGKPPLCPLLILKKEGMYSARQ